MRAALDKALRSQLEKTVQKAREIVETAVSEVLERLGIADNSAPGYLTDDERKLRNRLRAHGRQLGDVLQDGNQTTELLLNEMAYEHWHRMLFARFLEQNHLLMYDPQTPVTIDECNELAADEGFSDGWQLAAKLAEKMLPQIFKTGSPVFDVKLPINHIRALEQLISSLHPDTFQASDSLGWCYQFWQSKRKDEVNASGVLIGAQELSPVTQLFTEPYMVSFLLDNALGAWWAKRRLSQDDLSQAPNEQHLRELAAIPGVPLTYLRFVKVGEEGSETAQEQWQPAAGWFDAWPTELKDLKTLDPCCGSGHFLVALFLMLVPMRMQLEGLSERDAVDAVLRDNLHGLELDLRCVDIAAFAVALEAWRYPNAGGYRPLPQLQIACSGLDVTAASKNWQKIANGNPELTTAMQWFSRTFKDAPVLGSLIDPTTSYFEGKNEGKPAPWQLLLSAQQQTTDEEAFEAQVTAQGLALAAKLLASQYQLVATNVPYLKAGDQCEVLKEFSEKYFTEAKYALETTFMDRCHSFLTKGGVSAIVTQQYWLFLKYYQSLREKYLHQKSLRFIARIGSGTFEEVGGEVVNVCLQITGNDYSQIQYGIEFEKTWPLHTKVAHLCNGQVLKSSQASQLSNPDYRISFENISRVGVKLSELADFGKGSVTGDGNHYLRCFWELNEPLKIGKYWLNSPSADDMFSGRSEIILWDNDNFNPTVELGFAYRGQRVFGKRGVSVGKAGKFRFTPYTGEIFDDNTAVLCPYDEKNIPSIWEYCVSGQLQVDISKLDKKMSVTAGTFTKTFFDSDYWLKIANESFPNGLPRAFGNDPKQWIYHGHPCGSVIWDESKSWTAVGPRRIDKTVLQVAIARLLGYRWPAELDPELEIAEEMRYWMKQNSVFDSLSDDDGIVCIPAVRYEPSAVNRLEDILQLAYGEEWTAQTEQKLLASAGCSDLHIYLRDRFFEQHCQIFENRPFIWQIWDGLKDGFSVLVNYHKLDYKGLERLIYTYLGDWIRTQEHRVKEGVDGADIRLAAAKNLEKSLKAILAGEKGLDIFVRWKSKHGQPIGWNPDLNDGVRLNIRPFMKVTDVGQKGAGVLRIAPGISWTKKDRGTDVPSAPWYHLGLEYGGKEGDRINDHYLSLAEKQAARADYAKNKDTKA